jgi:hypothetical protein
MSGDHDITPPFNKARPRALLSITLCAIDLNRSLPSPIQYIRHPLCVVVELFACRVDAVDRRRIFVSEAQKGVANWSNLT